MFDKSIHIIALKMRKSHLDYKRNCCLKSVQEKFNIGENKKKQKKSAKFEKRLEEEEKGHLEVLLCKLIK